MGVAFIKFIARPWKCMCIRSKEPGCAKFFKAIGMHCLGCPSARGETIEQACFVHSTDADALIEALNDYLATK